MPWLLGYFDDTLIPACSEINIYKEHPADNKISIILWLLRLTEIFTILKYRHGERDPITKLARTTL
jgi:hypothetical protein